MPNGDADGMRLGIDRPTEKTVAPGGNGHGRLFGKGSFLKDPKASAKQRAALAEAHKERGRKFVEERRAGLKRRCPDCGTWKLPQLSYGWKPLAKFLASEPGTGRYESAEFEPDELWEGKGDLLKEIWVDILECPFLFCANPRCRVVVIISNSNRMQVVLRRRKYLRPSKMRNYRFNPIFDSRFTPTGEFNPFYIP